MRDLFFRSFKALGSPCEVQIYAQDAAAADSVFAEVISKVEELEAKYSRYRDESIISRINAAAGGEAVAVDDETAALLDFAGKCYEQSGGLFDITSGILRRAWDFKEKKIPSAAELERVLPLIGWDKVEWKKPHLRLTRPGMEIDFGGFGKEYAVDLACGVLQRRGIVSGLVNFGGDVRALETHPDGSPWRIGVIHPRKENATIASLELSGGAVATSGDYERYFEAGGKRYSHLLNPMTGFPVESFQSVSVYSELCLVAGTIATIAALSGESEGIKFLKDGGVHFLCVNGRGELIDN